MKYKPSNKKVQTLSLHSYLNFIPVLYKHQLHHIGLFIAFQAYETWSKHLILSSIHRCSFTRRAAWYATFLMIDITLYIVKHETVQREGGDIKWFLFQNTSDRASGSVETHGGVGSEFQSLQWNVLMTKHRTKLYQNKSARCFLLPCGLYPEVTSLRLF